MLTGPLVVLRLPASVRLLLPLVMATPPGAVMAFNWAMLLAWVFRLSALPAPVSVAVSCAAFTTPVWLTVPPAFSVTLPPAPVPVPVLMPLTA